jgi:hypothetical protein
MNIKMAQAGRAFVEKQEFLLRQERWMNVQTYRNLCIHLSIRNI